MLSSGMAKVDSPALTSSAWVTANENGSRMMKRVPWPGSVWISKAPRIDRMASLTTSMPTPRPEIWVTEVAVENPGRSSKAISSSSVAGSSGFSRPFSSPLVRIAAKLRPAPSSPSSKTSSAPSRRKVRVMVPISGLPSSRRRSGVSTPCASELRSMCSSGATMFSSTLRSTSASSPPTSSSARLPNSWADCRTTRRRRGTMLPNRTMPVRIRPCWISLLTLPCWSSSAVTSRACSPMVLPILPRSSAISIKERLTCCNSVKRSSSRGSNSCWCALGP